MGTKPQIVTRILTEKTAELVQEGLHGIGGQILALVPTESRPGASRMQDVEQLKRSADTARKRCDSGVLGAIKSHSEPCATLDVLARKDVPYSNARGVSPFTASILM